MAEILSASAFSQAVQFASLPLVALLFAPASFGVAASVASVGTIAGALVCGNYAQAIPVPSSEDDARALTRLCLRILGFSIAGLIVVTAGARVVIAFSWYAVWGVPLVALAVGVYEVGSAWATRLENYRDLARAALSRGLATPLVQVLSGLVSGSPVGLIVAAAVRQWAGTVRFARLVPPLAGMALAQEMAVANQFRRFALFGVPSRLASAINLQLPAVLIASVYGVTSAGLYALAIRISDAPVRLLAEAVGRVMGGRVAAIRRAATASVAPILARLLAVLVGAGIVLGIVVWFTGPPVVRLVTSERWDGLDDVVQVLAVLVGARMLFLPMARILPVLEMQRLSLVFDLSRAGWLLVSFGVGYRLSWSLLDLLRVYSWGLAGAYLLMAGIVLIQVRAQEYRRASA